MKHGYHYRMPDAWPYTLFLFPLCRLANSF